MSQDQREIMELDKIAIETLKLRMETNKLTEEVQKIRKETQVARWNRLRFWIGTVGVPVVVAMGTVFIVSKSDYFKAWETQIKNAEHDYKEETKDLNAKKDSLNWVKDSLSLVANKIQADINRLKKDSTNKANLIADLTTKLKNGFTNNQIINDLARKNDSLLHQIGRLNSQIGDMNEKSNFAAFLLLDARRSNRELEDSIKKLFGQQNYFNSMVLDKYQKQNGWLMGDTAIKGQYVRILTHLLDSAKIPHP